MHRFDIDELRTWNILGRLADPLISMAKSLVAQLGLYPSMVPCADMPQLYFRREAYWLEFFAWMEVRPRLL